MSDGDIFGLIILILQGYFLPPEEGRRSSLHKKVCKTHLWQYQRKTESRNCKILVRLRERNISRLNRKDRPMTVLKIFTYPDPVLRRQTQTITTFDDPLKQLAADMAETMWDAPGVGLAAPQVGRSVKLIVVDISDRPGNDKEKQWMALVNPEIITGSGCQLDEEGCLSVPGLTSKVTRQERITVRYQTLDGEERQLDTDQRFAVVLQHEIDHLNGILFIDHLSALKRNLYKKKVKKWLREKQHG